MKGITSIELYRLFWATNTTTTYSGVLSDVINHSIYTKAFM